MSGREGAVLLLRDITQRTRDEKTLRDSESKHRLLLNSIKNPVLALREDFTVFYCNESFAGMVDKTVDELEWRNILSVYPAIRRSKLYGIFSEVLDNGEMAEVEDVLGSRYLHMRVSPTPWGVLAVAEDFTEHMRVVEALKESEKRFRYLFESSPDAVFVENVEGDVLDVNPAACDLHGFSRDQLVGKNVLELVPAEYKNRVQHDFSRLVSGELNRADGYSIGPNGEEIPVEIRANHIEYAGVPALLLHVRDVTERRLQENRLAYMASHDILTDLPNRAMFHDRLSLELAHANRNKQKLGVMLLDLDKFKDVNDTMGHNVGDALLKCVGERLRGLFRRSDTVARMGGDEFTVILPEISGEEDIMMIANKILQAFRDPFNTSENKIRITTSIGIAFYPVHGDDPDVLLRNADIAMYRAKELGRDRFEVFVSGSD